MLFLLHSVADLTLKQFDLIARVHYQIHLCLNSLHNLSSNLYIVIDLRNIIWEMKWDVVNGMCVCDLTYEDFQHTIVSLFQHLIDTALMFIKYLALVMRLPECHLTMH